MSTGSTIKKNVTVQAFKTLKNQQNITDSTSFIRRLALKGLRIKFFYNICLLFCLSVCTSLNSQINCSQETLRTYINLIRASNVPKLYSFKMETVQIQTLVSFYAINFLKNRECINNLRRQ